MDEDKLLAAKIEDLIENTKSRYMITSGNFLDSHQKKITAEYCIKNRIPVMEMSDAILYKPDAEVVCFFYGGYEGAERSIPVFIPDYAEICDEESGGLSEEIKELLKVIRVTVSEKNRIPEHRDYLGSLMSLGIQRYVTGDILVRNGSSDYPAGADIIVLKSMSEFVLQNFSSAGRQRFNAETVDIDALIAEKGEVFSRTGTVSSLRLDSVTALVFGMSRAKAADAVKAGMVSVNGIESLKTDMLLSENDKVVMRKKGKAVITKIGGQSRKGKTIVCFDVYGKIRKY